MILDDYIKELLLAAEMLQAEKLNTQWKKMFYNNTNELNHLEEKVELWTCAVELKYYLKKERKIQLWQIINYEEIKLFTNNIT